MGRNLSSSADFFSVNGIGEGFAQMGIGKGESLGIEGAKGGG
jgi:hypothetical protein